MGEASQDQERRDTTQLGRIAIDEQLNRLLASPYFIHSKRLPDFLRFVVEHTLDGNVDNIKERTLGVEIFGRDAGYDTSSDPIVRVTAAEVRKRTAQYYQEPAHQDELRISLPSGSYIPQFHHSPNGNGRQEHSIGEPVAAEASGTALTPAAHGRSWMLVAAVAVAATCLVLGGAAILWPRIIRSPFDFFWQPVLSSKEPVLVCVADQLDYSTIALRDAADPTHQVLLKDTLTAMVIDDLNPTVKVASTLQANGRQYSLKAEGATTLDDLRRGPTVFIGAFDNAWTLRLTNPLRYHFANDADMTHLWVVDSTAPNKVRWILDRRVQMATNNYRDYAIVARFTDSNTGRPEVVVAGIGRGGTRVAGEFLTDNADLAQLMRAAHAAGDKKNMEVVLSTEIIEGEPGSPKMEAAYFW